MRSSTTRINLTDGKAILMLGAVIVLVMSIGCLSDQNDFIQFYIAGRQFMHRLNPYDTSVYPPGFRFGNPYPPLAIYLTLVPSLFKISTTVHLWDVLCLMLYMATIFLWAQLFWRQTFSVSQFSFLAVAAITAPCLWSFHYHHMIVPVLFFATLALWLMIIKQDSFLSGIATGAMLIKPHLLLLAAASLYAQSKSKGRFLAGLFLVIIGQIIPFLGFRPFSDLKGNFTNPNELATQVYWSDEQSVTSLIYRELYIKAHHNEYVSWDGVQGRLVGKRSTRQLNMTKRIGFAIGLIICWFLSRKLFSPQTAQGYAWLLAMGVWISPYSHSYDALLTTPLLLHSILQLSRVISFKAICAFIFYANLGLGMWLPMGSVAEPWWNHLAWCSTIYLTISAGLLYISAFARNKRSNTMRLFLRAKAVT